ncbi:hypothetical protein EVAR_32926_1 [Eumeta japonica]|uniref:Uncharacterized protein n=1 Tax=Eumeta variegata TaxID=151549 RepID=A0A4C1X6X9_EUMVA|nr:hypothetical protein EVAR_32926_1 [Eumeta japonica]
MAYVYKRLANKVQGHAQGPLIVEHCSHHTTEYTRNKIHPHFTSRKKLACVSPPSHFMAAAGIGAAPKGRRTAINSRRDCFNFNHLDNSRNSIGLQNGFVCN